MRSANVTRTLVAMFAVSATLGVSPAPAAATQTQLNEFDGSMCRLLNLSSDPPPLGAGYRSTIDSTGNLIQPPGTGASSVWFLCPATLSGNIASAAYAVKNTLFTIDLSDTLGNILPATCQGQFDTVNGAVNVLNPVANGVGLDTRTIPSVNRVFFVCQAAATSLLYLRSYSLTVTYVLP
jgi:hypothetical protein